MKLFVGAANTGKTTSLLSRLVDVLSNNRGNVLLLVPSMGAADVLKKRLEGVVPESLPARAKPSVITFPALYEKILKYLGINVSLLDAVVRNRLLRSAIRELTDEQALTYFNKTVDKPGLINSLSAFISELWRSGTDAETFAQLTRGRSPKDRDIALIFRRYQTLMDEAEATDAEGAGLLALQRLNEISARNIAKLKELAAFIAADGFDYYSMVQVRLLAQISKIGIETAATLTYEDDRDVHLWQRRTRERFAETGADVIHCSRVTDFALSRVASSLMLDAPEPLPCESANRETIRIISASDRAAEVRAIAREIKSLVLEENYAPEELNIVCRTLEPYINQFERIFEECGIPYFIDLPLALNENACVIAVLRLLRLAEDEFQRRPVIETLRSPYFNLTEFELRAGDVDIIEQLSFRERISLGRNLWREGITSPNKIQVNEDDSRATPEVDSRLALKLDAFFEALTFPPSAHRLVFVQKIKALIEKVKIEECLKQGERSATDEFALHSFLRVLDSLASREGNQPASLFASQNEGEIAWTAFLSELEGAVVNASFDRPKDAGPGVFIQEAHNLRPRNYRAIFIAGLIEGEFPRRSAEHSPYTLMEREELRRLGIDFTETTNDAGADLTQFYKGIAHASDKLFLSYARTELNGGELLKSYLIDEVKAITGIDEVRIAQVETEDGIDRITSFEELALMTAYSLRKDGCKKLPRSAISEATALLENNLKTWRYSRRGAEIEQGRLAKTKHEVFRGFISSDSLRQKIQADFGEDYLWTASKINDFGNCPFKFFAKNLLNLVTLEEPAEGFTYDRLGSVYHEILEKTYVTLNERGITLSLDTFAAAAAIVEELSERVFQEQLETRKVRRSRLWEFETGEIKKNIINLVRAESESNQEGRNKPLAFEKKFGMAGEPPLIVESQMGRIKFRGIIDRIDESDEGLVVIDYKTSRTPVSAREAQEGRNLQLPIYLMAASRVLLNDKPVESGHYLHIHSCKKGSQFPNKQTTLEKLQTQTEGLITEYVASVRRAEFPVNPKQVNCYQRCSYANLCRVQSLNNARDEEDR